jgi:hypothetical protein
MMSTLKTFFEEISQDIYSFLVAVAIFKLFYWWTHRKRSNVPRPLVKKHVSSSSSEEEITIKSAIKSDNEVRNRTSTVSRSRTNTDNGPPGHSRRPDLRPNGSLRKPSSGSSGLESEGNSRNMRLNPQATEFVPSSMENPQKVNQSIKRFKEVISDWEAKQKDLEDDAMAHLQDAIAGLAPQDAAMVQQLLDSKVADGGHHASQSARPFRPFNERTTESTRSWDHVRDHVVGPSRTGGRRPWTGARTGAAGGGAGAQAMDVEGSGEDSLRANLLKLASMDQARVIMVRKINQIGLKSRAALETYFSQFGTIEHVMVSHCMAKSSSGVKRLRPAALGFLVMSKVEEAQAALAQGEVQTIQGAEITVGMFESHPV